jgi:hypothetical protein
MRKITLFISMVVSLVVAAFAAALEAPRFAVATTPTPVLKTPDFQKVFGGKLKLDPCKGVRPVEFIAMTGTLFRIEGEQVNDGITVYRVSTNDYPYRTKTGYFIDSRFVKPVPEGTPERQPTLPPLAEVQQKLMAALGKPYVWGGNFKDGVPLLRELYPQADPLAGVDCSGLLYQATDGYTTRNTSALISFGKPVAVAGLTAERIAEKLEPLDLIVWKGHVMIVLDRDTIIQSTMGCQGVAGVHLSEKTATLRHLMKSRKPADSFPEGAAGAKAFVVRRWFPR